MNCSPQLAVIGDSISAFAFDQNAIAAAMGRPVLNASLPAADPEEWPLLFPRLFGNRSPDEILWAVTTHRLLLRSTHDCTALVDGRTLTSQSLRDQAFAMPDLTSELSFSELVFGPSGAGRYEGTIADARFSSRWTSAGGREPRTDEFDGRIATGEIHVRYPPPVVCPARLDALTDAIREFREGGAEVAVVLLPITETLFALAPAEHVQLAEQLRAAVLSVGAEMIELPGPLLDTETFDGWHPKVVGRDRLTDDLIAALAD